MYRISFVNHAEIYEIYVKEVVESTLFGFIEIKGFVWTNQNGLIIDTHEERLKMEFAGVQSTLIPMQSILRIDSVEKAGVGKIRDKDKSTTLNKMTNVTPFPLNPN